MIVALNSDEVVFGYMRSEIVVEERHECLSGHTTGRSQVRFRLTCDTLAPRASRIVIILYVFTQFPHESRLSLSLSLCDGKTLVTVRSTIGHLFHEYDPLSICPEVLNRSMNHLPFGQWGKNNNTTMYRTRIQPSRITRGRQRLRSCGQKDLLLNGGDTDRIEASPE